MCPFRDSYFVSNARACQRKLLNCPASSAATDLRGLVMPNDRKRPLGAVSVGHGRHLRWRGTRPQTPPVPQAAAGLVHHSDRGDERVIESSGFGRRNSPADCRCRMTDNSEVTGVHEKRLCARPAPDAEVETATVPSIVQTATQATGWIAG